MNKLGVLLLVCAVAGAAFYLGRQDGRGNRTAAPVVNPAPSVAAAPAAPDHTGKSEAKAPSAQPPQTFRGPDGLPHIINYGTGKPPDSSDPALVKAAVLADMKNHPNNIVRAYRLDPADISAILDGSKAFPETMLPSPTPAN